MRDLLGIDSMFSPEEMVSRKGDRLIEEQQTHITYNRPGNRDLYYKFLRHQCLNYASYMGKYDEATCFLYDLCGMTRDIVKSLEFE